MKKFAEKVLRFRFIIIAVYVVALVLSFIGMRMVKQNSNLLDYLPSDIQSVEAKEILDQNFKNDDRTISLLIKGNAETRDAISKSIVNNDYIVSVSLKEQNEEAGLYTVVLVKDVTFDDIDGISDYIAEVLSYHGVTGGIASGTEIISPELETGMMMAATFGVIILVILLFSKSYFDVVIILASVGISILLNMGTNIVFGTISKITFSAAALIQLTVSVDYSLFVLNNYRLAKESGLSVDEAIPVAVAKSSKSVLAGAITTIAGFIALMFMKLQLGLDLGMVLAKGIMFSLITALVLVPILIKVSSKLIDKLEHKPLVPNFKFLGKLVGNVQSACIVVLTLVLAVFAFVGQQKIDYIYGEPVMGEVAEYIQENFKKEQMLVVVVPTETSDNDVLLFTNKVIEKVGIDNLEGDMPVVSFALVKQGVLPQASQLLDACFASPSIEMNPYCGALIELGIPAESLSEALLAPEVMVPAVKAQLLAGIELGLSTNFIGTDGYQRIIIGLANPTNENETPELYNSVEVIRGVMTETFGDSAKMTGQASMLYDMRDLNRIDQTVVTLISILAVGLVILLAFKSIAIPLVLLVVIQSAIWMNFALSFVLADSLVFMGVIIVSSIQLGATIDYSILLTEKYEDRRMVEGLSKKEALYKAVADSNKSILTSGLALTLGGLMMYLLQAGTVAQLGLLLGRGALVSLVISLLVMPHFLFIFDKPILKTTLHKKKEATK